MTQDVRLAAITEENALEAAEYRAMRRLWRAGYVAVGLSFGALTATSGWATITGAVVAPAQIVVESNARRIQHPTGGVVSKLLVREGDVVKVGDLLVKLDATAARANVEILRTQVDELALRSARLEAERDDKAIVEPPGTMSGRLGIDQNGRRLREEQVILDGRRTGRDGQVNQTRSRMLQLRAEKAGLSRQLAARERELALVTRDLEGIRKLYLRSLVPVSRLSQLERDAAVLEGTSGQLLAQIAQLDGRLSETEMQAAQITDTFRNDVLRELKEAAGKLAEASERLTAAHDQHLKVDLRAPASGFVHQSILHTEGGVLGAGETAMLILPIDDPLNLEARVQPQDIDLVHAGQTAKIRLHAFNARIIPELDAIVSRIAADVTRDPQTGGTYYTVRLHLPPEQVKRLGADRLLPGMQADVLIETDRRTLISYLAKPIQDQFSKALRER